MGRTRDIEATRAPNSNESHGGSIANGLKGTWEVCNSSIRCIEEHLPDDLKSFESLLGPLIRCKNETATALKHWTQRSPLELSENGGESQLDMQSGSRSTRKLPSISTSSGSSIIPAGGLAMDARELCKIWTGCATNRFQLSSFQWFRDSVGARHEYLLFKLENGRSLTHSRQDLWLRIERRPRNKAGMNRRKLMGSLFGQFVADDMITLSPRREDLLCLEDMPLEPQASVVFGEKLSLRYLLDVLDIIHKESLEYHIAGANCWFYASTIAEIVTTKARSIWELGDISYCNHWKSKHVVNPEQYNRIMNRARQLREYCN